MLIHGRCHCGNIAFALDWAASPPEIPARACGCSFCTRHGGVWTSRPDAKLTVTVVDDAQVSRYAFGTRTATFHVCTHCGCVPVVTSEIENRVYAVVNVNMLEHVDPSWIRRASTSFDDETTASRRARRHRNRIADVAFAQGPSA